MRHMRFKDLFTTLNLFLSFYAVVLLFDGKLEQASYVLIFNALVLDILDGMVARLTKTSNLFGRYYDTLTDFFGSSMIVPFFIYFVLKDYNRPYAISVAFLPLFTGVLREIQQRMESVSVNGYFIGYPRNSASLIWIGLINSSWIVDHHWYWLVMVFSLILSYAQLAHIPFVGNDKSMLIRMPRMKFYLITCIVLLFGLWFIGSFWDGVVIFMCCYLISPYVIVDKTVWDDLRSQLKEIKV